MRSNNLTRCALLSTSLVAILALFTFASPLRASTAIIDETISLATAQGSVSNGTDTLPITPQVPGSLQTSLGGTLSFDISAGNITFFGGSLLVVGNQGSTFEPFGTDANIAGEVVNILPNITAVGAMRNFTFDVLGGPIALNADGTFDASGLFFETLSGTFDYEVPTVLGPFSDTLFGGDSLGNLTGSVTELPDGRLRVILPFSLSFLSDASGLTLTLDVAGRISAITPEPSSYALALMGAIGVVGAMVRRRRR